MKPTTLAAAALAFCVSLVSAGVVITPIRPDQVVDKTGDDCFFGVITPNGCGCVSVSHESRGRLPGARDLLC